MHSKTLLIVCALFPIVFFSHLKAASHDQIIETGRDLIRSIGPNRRLKLLARNYRIKPGQCRDNPHVVFNPNEGLLIKDTENLVIEGETGSRILAEHEYCVFKFLHCREIRLEKLEIGHDPAVESCSGGIVTCVDCKNVSLTECDLFGSGVRGLYLQNTSDFSFSHSSIESCTFDIAQVFDCSHVTFTDSTFTDNKAFFDYFNFADSLDVVFNNCIFRDNKAGRTGGCPDGMLFNLSRGCEILVDGCKIENNEAAGLWRGNGVIDIQETTFDGNSFNLNDDYTPADASTDTERQGAFAFRSVTVDNIEDLVSAIRPNEELRLRAKDYIVHVKNNLKSTDFVTVSADSWDGIKIVNVDNLTIKGSPGSRILMENPESAVITLSGCRRIGLVGLSIGHVPAADGCSGPVVVTRKCKSVAIVRSVLFGCGTEGFVFESSADVGMVDSRVEDCNSGIGTIDGSDVLFVRSIFSRNHGFFGVTMYSKTRASFIECEFYENDVDAPLFDPYADCEVRIEGGGISENRASALFGKKAVAPKMTGTKVSGNNFEK